MKHLVMLLSFGIALLMFQSCNKHSETVPESTYFGKWEIAYTSPGTVGVGYSLNFKFLEIDPSSNFKVINEDEDVIVEGKIEEVYCINNSFTINFSSEIINIEDPIPLIDETELMVNQDGNKLTFMAPSGVTTSFLKVE